MTASEFVYNRNDIDDDDDDDETVEDEYNHAFHSCQRSNNLIFNRHINGSQSYEKYLHTSQHHSNLHSKQNISAQIRVRNLSVGLKHTYKPKLQGNKTRKNCASENLIWFAPLLKSAEH